MIKKLEELRTFGQFIFYEDDYDKFEGINTFHKAFWKVDERIEDTIYHLVFEYEKVKNIRNSDLRLDYTNVMTVVVSNVIRMITSKKEYIRISLNSNNYRSNNTIKKYEPIKITYTVFRNIINWLAEYDYINLYKGENNPIVKLGSLIEPLNKLKELCEGYNYTSVNLHPNFSLVHLKNEEKNLIDYEETEETIYRNTLLNCYNKYLNSQKIEIDNCSISYPITLESKFNEKIGKNGRIFGADWMTCKSELRDTIRINGKETIELDFSNCAIRLAGHLNDIDIPIDKDLYDIKVQGVVRAFVKRIATRSFNIKASTIKDLANKVTNSIYKESREGVAYTVARGKLDKYNLDTNEYTALKDSIENDIRDNENDYEYLKRQYGFPWSKPQLKEQITMICKELYKVAGDYLLDRRGLELQYIESKICFKVIEKFLNLNKPVLSIHDSFIVLAEDSKMLKSIMIESYEEVVGIGCKPSIK